MTAAADLTLDEVRALLAPAIADAAVFDGWSAAAVNAAAQSRGIDPQIAALAFSDGAMAMITAWVRSVDLAMAARFAGNALAKSPIRERIRRLVSFRLEALAGREEALRRALSIMAMPQNMTAGLRLGWDILDGALREEGGGTPTR